MVIFHSYVRNYQRVFLLVTMTSVTSWPHVVTAACRWFAHEDRDAETFCSLAVTKPLAKGEGAGYIGMQESAGNI